jgi:hypothetical protein
MPAASNTAQVVASGCKRLNARAYDLELRFMLQFATHFCMHQFLLFADAHYAAVIPIHAANLNSQAWVSLPPATARRATRVRH